jgi:glutamate racemase
MSPEDPIGIFDSGVGGLTVLREISRLLPNENIVYLGDTARFPYGNKSPKTLLRYTLENASFLIEQKIKCLIIACFTASSYALEELQQRLSIPVIGVIQSDMRDFIVASQFKRIAILGTSGTIQSGVIQDLLQQGKSPLVTFPVACPLLAPLIEEGLFNHLATRMIASDYLDFLKEQHIDSALLACTHYPLMRSIIQDILGPTVYLIEPASHCALKTRTSLASFEMLNSQNKKGSYEFYATDDPEKFCRLANLFFPMECNKVEKK